MAHTTSFTSGDFKGKYLLLNTIIPDSVMSVLSKSMETVVLWRWNKRAGKSLTVVNSLECYEKTTENATILVL